MKYTHVIWDFNGTVLADMEAAGFRVDTAGLRAFDAALGEAADRETEAITEMAGIAFNINSPKQLGEVLFDRLGLPYPKKRKAGAAYSTDAKNRNFRIKEPVYSIGSKHHFGSGMLFLHHFLLYLPR